jgi:hypothetical protein
MMHAFNTMQLNIPSTGEWYMDSVATTHMTLEASNITISHPHLHPTPL